MTNLTSLLHIEKRISSRHRVS